MRLRAALDQITAETDLVRHDLAPETGEIILHGMSEYELELAVYRVQQEFQIELSLGAPNVAYLEAFRNTFICEHAGPSVRLKLKFEPTGAILGPMIVNSQTNALPEQLFAGVQRGIESACWKGPIAEAPVAGAHVLLVDASFDSTVSRAEDFKQTAEMCWRKSIPHLGMMILEPIMAISVTTPQEYLGDIIGDLISRRCAVQSLESADDGHTIGAFGPIANLFGYRNAVGSMTKGCGHFEMRFERYESAPLMGRYRP
jgi:elongation factor G